MALLVNSTFSYNWLLSLQHKSVSEVTQLSLDKSVISFPIYEIIVKFRKQIELTTPLKKFAIC